MTSAKPEAVVSHCAPFSIASLVIALVCATTPVAAHSDIPEADAACTGPVLLNDDLPPLSGVTDGHAHRIVSARAEIVAANGVPVGTLYLDDRGERYAAFVAGTSPAVVADFFSGRAGTLPAGADGGVPVRLSPGFALGSSYRLAACR